MKRLRKTILKLNQLESRIAPAISSPLIWQGDVSVEWGAGTVASNTNWIATIGGANKLPVDGSSLTFPAAALNKSNNNGIAGLDLNKLTFTGDSYDIFGETITLSGGLTANYASAGASRFFAQIRLAADQTFSFSGNAGSSFTFGSIELGGKTLTADNSFLVRILPSGAGTIVKNGSGTLSLLPNAFTGPLLVNAGVLSVELTSGLGASGAGNGTTVASGASLVFQASVDGTVAEALTLDGAGAVGQPGAIVVNGEGTAENVTLSGPVRLSRDATIAGGGTSGQGLSLAGLVGAADDALAILTVNSATLSTFAFTNTATFTTELAGTTPGASGHDQLKVIGPVNLGGAALNVVPSFTPAIGAKFTIVNNDGADPIVGTFAGLAEGATVTAGGVNFKISYRGVDGANGNDVVLTVDSLVDVPVNVTLSADAKTATFTDRDGDIVTVKTTKVPFQQSDFRVIEAGVGGQLQLLNLSTRPAGFTGANLTISAKPGPLGGNGFVNVGYINATGIDLGAVRIAGDLGRIAAGTDSGDVRVPALKSLDVASIGLLGTSTQASGGDRFSLIKGVVPKLAVKGDLRDASFNVLGNNGKLGAVRIGGSVSEFGAAINANKGIGSLNIGGDIRANGGVVSIASEGGPIGAVNVGGSITGTNGGNVLLKAFGQIIGPASGRDLALKSLTVKGSVEHLGLDLGASTGNTDAAVGSITIAGDWIASTVLAGILFGPDSEVGTDDDTKTINGSNTRDNPNIFSTIGSFTVKGQAFGTADNTTDMFGVVAERIGKAKVGGRTYGFVTGTNECFFAAPTLNGEGTEVPMFDFTIRELGSTTPTVSLGGPNLNISSDGKTATFTDVDGDFVTVKTSVGTLDNTNFNIATTASGGGQLRLLFLGGEFDGANISITAKPGANGGNGFVNVGEIDAAGVDLGTVLVVGELEDMDAGDADPARPGIGILTVQSLGDLAGTTGNPGEISSRHTIGRINVKTDVREVDIKTNLGNLGTIQIGGSVTGDVFIASVGDIGAIKIGGSWRGEDVISAVGRIGTIDIGGDLIGRGNGNITLEALAKGAGPARGLDLAIKRLTVKGNIEGARINLGVGHNADASIGTISVGRAWLESSVQVGVQKGADGFLGSADDEKTTGANLIDVANRFSTISSIVIKGQALGSTTANDHFGIVAEQILKVKIGSRTFNFDFGERDAVDAFAIAPTGPGVGGLDSDFFLREIV